MRDTDISGELKTGTKSKWDGRRETMKNRSKRRHVPSPYALVPGLLLF